MNMATKGLEREPLKFWVVENMLKALKQSNAAAIIPTCSLKNSFPVKYVNMAAIPQRMKANANIVYMGLFPINRNKENRYRVMEPYPILRLPGPSTPTRKKTFFGFSNTDWAIERNPNKSPVYKDLSISETLMAVDTSIIRARIIQP
jgi:hypothetical protein